VPLGLARTLLRPYGSALDPGISRACAPPTRDDLDKALRELDSLTAALSADVREAGAENALSAPARLRKEALMTTRILVSKLQVVRALESPPLHSRQFHHPGNGAHPFRMPALLTKEDREQWLTDSAGEATTVLKQYPEERMVTY
jgi:hypothetical protein